MKELSIEEKAKCYDEAVNEIKNLRDMLLKEGVINKNGVIWDNFNRIFPELKESEDERIRKEIIEDYRSAKRLCKEGEEGTKSILDEKIAWLEKQGEQKHAEWSEEDDEMLDSIIEEVRYIGDFPDYPTKEENELYDECLSKVEWLKSLKDRVQPQSKQEWSEEDEDNFNSAIYYIRREPYMEKTIEPIVDWLESLKDRVQPQNTWKPSDEQMEGIEWTIKTLKYQLNAGDNRLDSLYNDLKKLREK